MKFAFLLGGIAGFLAGAGTALFCEAGSDRILLDGAVGCLVGGLLFRWFWNCVIACLREALMVRQREAAEAAAKRAAAERP